MLEDAVRHCEIYLLVLPSHTADTLLVATIFPLSVKSIRGLTIVFIEKPLHLKTLTSTLSLSLKTFRLHPMLINAPSLAFACHYDRF